MHHINVELNAQLAEIDSFAVHDNYSGEGSGITSGNSNVAESVILDWKCSFRLNKITCKLF